MVRWSPSLPCSFRNKLKQTEREGRPTPRSCERAGGRSVGHTALICCAVWLSRMPPKKTSTKKPKAARTVSPPGKAASKAETSNRTKTAAKPLQRKPTSPSKKKKSSGSPPKKPKAASGYPQASARKSSNMSSLLPSPPLGKSMRPSTPVASEVTCWRHCAAYCLKARAQRTWHCGRDRRRKSKQQLLWCHACRQKQLQHNASGVSSVKGKGEAQSLHVPAT